MAIRNNTHVFFTTPITITAGSHSDPIDTNGCSGLILYLSGVGGTATINGIYNQTSRAVLQRGQNGATTPVTYTTATAPKAFELPGPIPKRISVSATGATVNIVAIDFVRLT